MHTYNDRIFVTGLARTGSTYAKSERSSAAVTFVHKFMHATRQQASSVYVTPQLLSQLADSSRITPV